LEGEIPILSGTKLSKRWIQPLLVVLLVVLLTAPAFAHANLVRSSPQNGEVTADTPPRISLQFSEPLEVGLITLTLYDAEEKKIPTAPPQLTKGNATEMYIEPPALKEGSYTVVWSVVSEDGHPVEDRLTFAVRQPTPGFVPFGAEATPSTDVSPFLLIATRYIAEGLLLLGGGMFAVARWARRYDYPAPSRLLGRARPFLWTLLVLATLSEWLTYSASLPKSLFESLIAGDFGSLFESPFATMVSVQLLLLLLLAIPGMVTSWYALLWALLIGNLAFGGHAWAIQPAWLSLTARVLHLLAIALWIGGVAYLLLVARWHERGGQSAHQGAFRSLFLRIALCASLLTVLTGLLMVGMQTDWTALLTSPLLWRDLMLCKLLLTFAVLQVAFFQTKRWRTQYQSLSYTLLRVELLVAVLVILLGVWLSQIEYPLP
jgi:copper transport protein